MIMHVECDTSVSIIETVSTEFSSRTPKLSVNNSTPNRYDDNVDNRRDLYSRRTDTKQPQYTQSFTSKLITRPENNVTYVTMARGSRNKGVGLPSMTGVSATFCATILNC